MIQTPSDWKITEKGSDTIYTGKTDGGSVVISSASAVPTIESVKRDQVPQLEKQGKAIKVADVKSQTMPNGTTIIYVVYTSESNVDQYTRKSSLLDNVTWYFYKNKKLAALTLWAPKGTANANLWKQISESFMWM